MRIKFPSLLASGLLGLAMVSGCASVQDYHYEHTQRLRASSQYRECGSNNCSKYPRDYKAGWKDGFYEVSTGGSNCPPAIAPAKYWKPGQILDDCDNRRHAYYSGWQDGAARATQFPDTHFLKVWETCDCPFPRCNESCSTAACGCQNAIVVDDGMVEANVLPAPIIDANPAAGNQHGEMIQDAAPAPQASPVEAKPAVNNPSVSPANESATEELPAPNPDDTTAVAPTDVAPSADYSFTKDGGVVIDFTSEKQPASPSDFLGSPVVTGTVAELDFTFGDEDINDDGMIEFDED